MGMYEYAYGFSPVLKACVGDSRAQVEGSGCGFIVRRTVDDLTVPIMRQKVADQ